MIGAPLDPAQRHRLSARALSVALATGIILAATGVRAAATHDYDGMMPTAFYNEKCVNANPPTVSGHVCRTDNADLYWYADSIDPRELESNDVSVVTDVLSTQYAPTVLAIHYDSTPVFEGSGETDLILQEAEAALPMPSGAAGVTWCNDAVNGAYYECDQTYVRIPGPDGFRVHGGSVTCHEIGHVVGLVHGNDASPRLDAGDLRLGCMVNENEFPPGLGSANMHLINDTY